MLSKMPAVSGRFITLLIDSVIYPTCVVLCGYLCVIGKITSETFIAVLGGYALLVKETRQNYFQRTDRTQQPGTQTTSTTSSQTDDKKDVAP